MNETIMQRTASARIPTPVGTFRLCHYSNARDDKEHLALVLGEVQDGESVLVRVHSECMTGDVFGSLRCDCGDQLHAAMQQIAAEGRGVIIYLRQEGRGIGLAQKLRAYNLQDEGYDTVDANLLLGHQADERTYWAAVGILKDLQIRSVRLLTNNPAKIEHLREQGVNIAAREPLEVGFQAENAAYLETKVRRMRHLLRLPAAAPANVTGQQLPPELARRVDELRRRAGAYAEERGQPFVTLSYAQSLDGSIAALRGQPLTLSGPLAMTLTHALRAAHDAILVGVGTVIADDPRLTVRLVAGPDPQPIVLDSRLRIPSQAAVLRHPKGVWLVTTSEADALHPLPPAARLLKVDAGTDGRVDLRTLLQELGRRGVRSIMVEGGAQVLTSFIEAQLAQSAVITIAPRFVGGVNALQPAVSESPLASLAKLPRLASAAFTPAGEDVIVWGDLVWPEPYPSEGHHDPMSRIKLPSGQQQKHRP